MDDQPLINILTRTSGRPVYFKTCLDSINNQTYKNVNHIVCVDDQVSADYVLGSGITPIIIDRQALIDNDPLRDKNPYTYKDGRSTGRYSPHNLYCNVLNRAVKSGWVIYLDDDDFLIDNNVLNLIANTITSLNEDTIIYWQMKRNHDTLPEVMPSPPRLAHIGAPCFTFNSKYIKHAEWDGWKCGDFRVITRLHENIPKKAWLHRPLIRIPQQGLGTRNDKVK